MSWRHLDACGFTTVITAEVSRGQRRETADGDGDCAVGEKSSRLSRSFEAFWVEVLRATRSLSDACELLGISCDKAHRSMQRAVGKYPNFCVWSAVEMLLHFDSPLCNA